MSESNDDTGGEPESDYTNVAVPDQDLPEDLKSDGDNPLAGVSDDEAEPQDLGDPHIEGLERDDDDHLTLRDSGSGSDEDGDGES